MSAVCDPSIACREELERVLASESFRHSAGVCKLLRYLGERELSGNDEIVKEFTIGVEAFHKADGYDPQTDPLVRVLASKLRHKLDEYYRVEGAASGVRLELPKGHYRLHFEPRLPAIDTPPPEARRWRHIAYVLGSLLAVAVAALLMAGRPSGFPSREVAASAPDAAWNAALEQLWQPYLHGHRPVLIVFGTPLFTHFSGAFLRDPKLNQWEDAESSDRMRRAQKAVGSSFAHPSYNFTGIGEAQGIFLVSQLLLGRKQNARLKRSSAVTWDEIASHSVIFLGPPKFNLHSNELPFEPAFTIERGWVKNLRPAKGEPARYEAVRTPSHSAILEDHALISSFPGLHGQGRIVILACSSTEGTGAAAEYFTGPQYALGLVEKLRGASGKLPEAYQVLIHVKFKEQAPVQITYVTHRELHTAGRSAR
jgi:hypothetical protein